MLIAFCKSIAWLVLIGAVMRGLETLKPVNPGQKLLRQGFFTDLIYWLAPCFLYGPLAPKPIAAAFAWTAAALTGSSAIGFAVVARQPFWAQALEIFLIGDFLSYWAHRWLHGRHLWAFHAIHHGPGELDWLSTIRNHPVNVVIQRIVITSPFLLFGFPVATILAVAPFTAIYDIFTHANLDWRFGPLRYVLVSPVLHRWHHTPEAVGCNSNFGETLAIWDVLFGTFRLPQEAPKRLGLDESPPDDIVGQTLWPIRSFLETAPAPAVGN